MACSNARNHLRLATLVAAMGGLAGMTSAQQPLTTGAIGAPAADFGLRGTTILAQAGQEPVTAAILPGASSTPQATSGTVRRPTRSPRRTSRKPAAAPVRAPIRAATASPDIAAPVQAPILGLPDPAPGESGPIRRRRIVEADPYAPLGWRFGGLTAYPVIGQGLGYDNNPNRSFLKRGSLFWQSEAELRLQSDWSRHELTANLRGAFNDYPDLHEADRPEGAGRVNLRLDVARDTQVDLEARYSIDTQRPGSPELGASVRDRPLVASEGASLGVTQRFNRFSVGLKGSFDRTDYEDATLSSGTVLPQGFRNFNQYGAQLRASYELKPGVVSYVEALADTRDYDSRFDEAGFRRSSEAAGARIGTTFELSRLVTGEVSAGYQQRSYDDPRLRDLKGPLADALIVWSVTPLTTLRLNGQTRMDETTVAGASGIVTARGTVEIQHDLRRNLSLTAGVTFADYDYRGAPIHESSIAASLRADYRLTRRIGLRASYTHEKLNSNVPSSDYSADVFLLSLRLQP